MALISCSECGREISDKADKCPHCGNPIISKEFVTRIETEKGFWSGGRTAIGVISIVLFFVVSFQSCAVGVGNALGETGDTTGTTGIFFSFIILISGIVGLSTRNSKSKIGAFVTSFLYLFAFLITRGTGENFGDLPIWGNVSLFFSLLFFICAIKTKKKI